MLVRNLEEVEVLDKNTKHILLNRRRFLNRSVVAGGGAALGVGLMGFPAIAIAKKSITIGYIPILDHLVLAVSHFQDNRFFNSVNVEPRLFKSWRFVAGALEAGVIDGAFLLSNMAMDVFNQGVPIQSILVGHRHGSGITVRVDSAIKSAADLAGKIIAIPAKISTHTALLDVYLRTAGISLKDVTIREVAPSHMVAAMVRDSIDAFIVAEPFCARAEQEGVGRTLTFSKDILAKHICCVLVVRNEVLAANQKGVQELVNSMVRAGQWIDQKKLGSEAGEVAKIAAHYMPHTEKIILGGLQHPDDRVVYKDLNPRHADFQAIVDISRRADLIQAVDLDRFINSNFFENIVI